MSLSTVPEWFVQTTDVCIKLLDVPNRVWLLQQHMCVLISGFHTEFRELNAGSKSQFNQLYAVYRSTLDLFVYIQCTHTSPDYCILATLSTATNVSTLPSPPPNTSLFVGMKEHPKYFSSVHDAGKGGNLGWRVGNQTAPLCMKHCIGATFPKCYMLVIHSNRAAADATSM